MVRSKVKIGVLALQGDFAEHISVLDNLNVNCTIVKKPNELSDINGLIIPGGESTTIKKLIDRYDFEGEIKENKILGTSFHPEISGSTKVHEYFVNLTKE